MFPTHGCPQNGPAGEPIVRLALLATHRVAMSGDKAARTTDGTLVGRRVARSTHT